MCFGTNFDKQRSLSWYSSLADWGHGVFFLSQHACRDWGNSVIILINTISLILQHTNLLAGNDHKINNKTTAVTRHRPLNSNIGTMFSVWSIMRCHIRTVSGVEWVDWRVSESVSQSENCWCSVLEICCCEKLVAEARDSSWTQSKGRRGGVFQGWSTYR
jgi:hypothetical protein